MTAVRPAIATWSIDAAHSNAEFSVKHMMVATVKGRFGAFTGTLTFDEADPARAAVEASIDIASIITGEQNPHALLRGAAVFDDDTYADATLRSTRVEPGRDGRATG